VRRTAFLLVAVVLVVLARPVSAAPTSGKFLALTYNVAGLPQGISGSDPMTNSPLISPLLNKYDVVLLQEDWADPIPGVPLLAFHDEIVADANHRYQSEPAEPPRGTDLRRFPHGPTWTADGLNQLSRFRFGRLVHEMWDSCFGELHMEAIEVIVAGLGLSDVVAALGLGETVDGGSSDCSAQKGFTMSRMRLAPGVEVDLYNLHGEAGSGPQDDAASAAGFEQLTDYILAKSKGRAVIVGGDTNLHTDLEARFARDRRVWDQFQKATGVFDVCRRVDCGKDAGVIDKFAFRSGRTVQLKALTHRFERKRFTRSDGEPLSDHDPLAVTFSWRKL
jgi:hypothetical protein